jgi:hypothetical protein
MTENLQLTVLRILMSKVGWVRYSDLITPEILPKTDFTGVYEHLRRVHGDVEGDVSKAALKLDIEARGRRLELLKIIERIPDETPEGAEKIVERWVAAQWRDRAARYHDLHSSTMDFDPDVYADLVARAMAVGSNTRSPAVSIHDAPVPGSHRDREGVVGLGISGNMDRELNGGVGAGELCVFLAPSSRGKSTILCAIGARAATRGVGVLHVSLELSRNRIFRRYEESWTGRSRKALLKDPDLAVEARSLVAATGGSVFVKEWLWGEITPSKVQSLIELHVTNGDSVGLVIVDALDEMEPNPRYRRGSEGYSLQHYHGLERLCVDMRRVAARCAVPIVSAWQTNRGAYGSASLALTDTAGSMGPVKRADIIIGLDQGRTERENDEMRLSVLKSRESKNRPSFKIYADTDRCQFRDKEIK